MSLLLLFPLCQEPLSVVSQPFSTHRPFASSSSRWTATNEAKEPTKKGTFTFLSYPSVFTLTTKKLSCILTTVQTVNVCTIHSLTHNFRLCCLILWSLCALFNKTQKPSDYHRLVWCSAEAFVLRFRFNPNQIHVCVRSRWWRDPKYNNVANNKGRLNIYSDQRSPSLRESEQQVHIRGS